MKKCIFFRKIVFLIIAVIFTINFVNQVRTVNRISNQKQEQQVKLESLQKDTQRLEDESEKVQSDEYLEKLAREKLGMIKDGEFSVVYKVNENNWLGYNNNNIYFWNLRRSRLKMTLAAGKILEGTVVNITNFGAFVEVEGKTGLVHISEVADSFVKDIREHLKEQDKVKVKVISIDDNGKISLSIKQANIQKKSVKPVEFDWSQEKAKAPNSSNFEDKISKFLKDSEEKMQDVKKHQEFKSKNSKNKS